jgi:uncharacterized damage-inducible protein DinB
MEKNNEISSRFREVLLNGKWIANTNYKDLLSDLSRKQATKKIGTLNTIAALVQHVNYYISGILNVFEGGNLEIRDKYSFDFPSIETNDDWENVLRLLFANAEKFAKHVEQMPDDQLEHIFEDEKYGTYRRNIEAMIEHSYYHLGQISLIKKILKETDV